MGLGRGWARIGLQSTFAKTRPWSGLSGVEEGLGMHRIGQVGPVRFEWGRVGPSGAQ